jgi:hypothetical protein
MNEVIFIQTETMAFVGELSTNGDFTSIKQPLMVVPTQKGISMIKIPGDPKSITFPSKPVFFFTVEAGELRNLYIQRTTGIILPNKG